MFAFTITLKLILKPTVTASKAILMATGIIEDATKSTAATKLIAANDLMFMPLQMDFIMLNFQRDYPINFIAAANFNHQITENYYLIQVSFCLDHSFRWS